MAFFPFMWIAAIWARISPYIPWPSNTAATASTPAPSAPPSPTPIIFRSHRVSAEELEHTRAQITSGVLTALNNSQLPEHERRMGGIFIIKWDALADGSMRFALSSNSLAYEQALYRALDQQRGLSLTVVKGHVTVDADDGPGKQVVTTLSLLTPRAAAASERNGAHYQNGHGNGGRQRQDAMTACELFRFLAVMTVPMMLLYWLLV